MSPANKRTKSRSRKPPPSRQAQARAKAAQRRAPTPARRGANNRVKWIAVAVIIAFAVALLLALGGSGSNKKSTHDSLVPEFGRARAPASLVRTVTSVPAAVLDQVGAGTGVMPRKINDAPPGAKPAILFIGAEFCPYCAADRWAIVNALGRFGTWQNLQVTHSSARDAFPDTETFSFYGAKYSSPYLTFTGVEQTTNEPSNGYYKVLDKGTQQQQDLMQKFTTGYPFLYIAGQFDSLSAYDPAVLEDKTHTQIATALHDPNSPIAKAAIGTANGITAAICSLTKDQPTNACTPTITALEKQLTS